jgi:hypothetical protein
LSKSGIKKATALVRALGQEGASIGLEACGQHWLGFVLGLFHRHLAFLIFAARVRSLIDFLIERFQHIDNVEDA